MLGYPTRSNMRIWNYFFNIAQPGDMQAVLLKAIFPTARTMRSAARNVSALAELTPYLGFNRARQPTRPTLSNTSFIALNAIYLKKTMTTVTAATISEMTALTPETVSQSLLAATDEGWLIDCPTGVILLPEGAKQVLAYYRDIYADVRIDPSLIGWYQNFELLTTLFMATVSKCQRLEDVERIDRCLLQAAERLVKNIGQLVAQIPRYITYMRRLECSMDCIQSGLRDFVCKPTVDSMLNIWLEFHEDLLTVLGRPRGTT